MATCVDFKPGLRVRVINQTMSGRRITEGMATIRKVCQGDKTGVHAMVEFDGEPGGRYARWVFAADQDKALEHA